MRISNAIPVQFWLNGFLVYNEDTEQPGVIFEEFYQVFNSGDTIRIQFMDTTGSNYVLRVTDCKIKKLVDLDFVEIEEGVYELNFICANLDTPITDKLIKLHILKRSNIISNNFQNPPDWTNTGSGGNWSIVDDTARINFIGSAQSSKRFVRNLLSNKSGDVKVKVILSQSATADIVNFRLGLGATDLFFATTGVGDYTFEDESLATAVFNSIDFEASSPSLGTKLVTVQSVSIYVGGEEIVLAYSDLLDIQPNHINTLLLQYANKLPFAGNQFTDDEVFSIRLPCKFFEERSPEEDESEELTDGQVVKLMGSVKDQMLLEMDFMPYFMHKKIKRVLHCNTLYIKTKYWVKEEGYNVKDRPNPYYPFAEGSCWLTQKIDGYDTNVYGEGVEISGVFDESFDAYFDRISIS